MFRSSALLSKLSHRRQGELFRPLDRRGSGEGFIQPGPEVSRGLESWKWSSATRFERDQPKVERSWRYLRTSRAIRAVQIWVWSAVALVPTKVFDLPPVVVPPLMLVMRTSAAVR